MAKDLSGVQAGTVQEADVNNPSVKTYRGKNMFPQSFQHPSTCRYGEVDPVFAAKCEVGDVYHYKFNTDLDTFTLASKMKSKVKMKVAAFKVPLQAIYPRNWVDRMLTKPVQGDDVPDDARALFDVNLYKRLLQSGLRRYYPSDGFSEYVKFVLLMEQVYSAGSLFSKFNMHLDSTVFNLRDIATPDTVSDDNMYFDDWFDSVFVPCFISTLSENIDFAFIYKKDNNLISYKIAATPALMAEMQTVSLKRLISVRRALELLRTGEYYLDDRIAFTGYTAKLYPFNSDNVEQLINIEPIIAYQLACSHFFSNSKVDFVYTAQIYRDNLQGLIFEQVGNFPTFTYNGVDYQYDIFSQHVFGVAIDYEILEFFQNLFEFQRSLRYGDYFTGSRVAPLAVGDIDAPVVDNSVNALDMTRKLQITRYLNRVNISGPRFADYIRNILGGHVPEAPKDVPVKLSEISFDVDGFEVNNTGDAQLNTDYPNITTSALRLTGQNYMFEVSINEPCWLVGVQFFEAHRIYTRTMDRFAWHYDRYDDFIPDMQYTGDQDIKTRELDYVHGGSEQNFAYNLRYMEYKQRYSYASGGFIRALRTWAFITDNSDGNPYSSFGKISPEYIRSSPTEFDRFYKSLTGYSMGTYFHFITFNTNVCVPYRQMVYAPEILA